MIANGKAIALLIGIFPHITTTQVKDRAKTLPEQSFSGPEPSKTSRKHQMHALQDLGERLVALDASRLAQLGLPERLEEAIVQARKITAHEGRRRQMQFIGKLMRDVDADEVAAALELWNTGPKEERARFARMEQWRERLLAEPAALEAFVADHPQADRVRLAEMIHEALAERARGTAPHQFRALFRYVKSVLDTPAL